MGTSLNLRVGVWFGRRGMWYENFQFSYARFRGGCCALFSRLWIGGKKMRDYVIDFDVNNIGSELRKIVSEMKKVYGVLAVYVFGSYVANKMHGLSDVDICVVGNVSSNDKTDVLLGKFPEIFDISFFEDLPIWIKARVFREGECLFARNEKTLNLVKLMTLREYLDFKPVIDDIIDKELAINV